MVLKSLKKMDSHFSLTIIKKMMMESGQFCWLSSLLVNNLHSEYGHSLFHLKWLR